MFSVVLFAYLTKEDVQNVLLVLVGKPWDTGMILWSVAAISTLASFKFGLHWSWSKNHRNEVRIIEDHVWTTKRWNRSEHYKRLAEIRNPTQA